MASLTAEKVRKMTEAGRYGDGGGLYFLVSPGGSRSWIQRIRIDGNRTDKGLGGFPAVTLTEARHKAAANRVAVAEGRNPWDTEERQRKARLESLNTIPTFEEAARKVHALNMARWTNGKHTVSWMQSLERHAFPALGDMRLDEITRADALDVLTPIWTKTPETARRVRHRIRATFKWAVSYGYVDVNPAGEAIDGALPPMPKYQKHLDALPYQHVGAAIKAIKDSESWPVTKACFHFLILTAARSGEVRGATWDEVDLAGHLWSRPGERMKNGKAHRQPLSIQASVLLRMWKDKTTGEGLVFPAPNGKQLSENALSLRARKCGLGCVPHGFRSSFRDWAAECSGAGRDAIELSLAHEVGNAVERAYFRSDLLEQRRELMQEWANYLEPLPF